MISRIRVSHPSDKTCGFVYSAGKFSWGPPHQHTHVYNLPNVYKNQIILGKKFLMGRRNECIDVGGTTVFASNPCTRLLDGYKVNMTGKNYSINEEMLGQLCKDGQLSNPS